jgi:hypothetical protein
MSEAKHDIETIREAMFRMHRTAIGDPRGGGYMSIPADPRRDADLILGAAIDELAALRAQLDAAVGALVEAERALTVAVRVACEDMPDFDPGEHVVIKKCRAALRLAREKP